MRKLFHLTALYVILTGGALLAFGAKPAAAEGCTDRPSGAPKGWRCVLVNDPVCSGGICSCDYLCTPP
jgi:hypothetical protein